MIHRPYTLPFTAATLLVAVITIVSIAKAQECLTDSALGLNCEVYCSQDKIRTAVAEISWLDLPISSDGAEADVADVSSPKALDTTVFKDGFDREIFKSFDLEEDSDPGEADALPESQPLFPAFDLQIIETKKSVDTQLEPSPEADLAPAERQIKVIEGLEAGLYYKWRLQLDNGSCVVVTCQAPVCPADLEEDSTNDNLPN